MFIKTTDSLPEPGKYVLVRLNSQPWQDSTDQKNVLCRVVKLVKGISMEERSKMKSGILPDPLGHRSWCQSDGWSRSLRSQTYQFGDESGNNRVPYAWEEFGPSTFFGQDVIEWMYIPKSSYENS